ncbi:MAG: NADH-quinone oxidoreductase subunit L, partial [Firmicutes bacterium]|nr:NADH-quinone oxidoreductase subunit L [Bacillota bacterium]
LNLPGRKIAGKMAPWVVAAVCALQAAMAATSGLGFWRPVDDALRLPVQMPLEIDWISAVVLAAVALASAAANIVGSNGDSRRRINLGSLTLMLMTGMDGAVMVRDLFSLYVFLEITAVASFILIAMEKDAGALEGAFKYVILSGLATAAMLAANALIFMRAGSLRFADIGVTLSSGDAAVQTALVLYVAAFCVKAGVVPFHGWLPGAYSASPDAVSVLLAGVVTKVAGAFAVIRLAGGLFAGLAAPGAAFMALGAFSIVVGAFAAIGQTDMKRMLAYSSISQIGYIILAAGLGTPLAIAGAVLHFFNHSVFKSLLFVNAAAVREQTGTTDMNSLGGLAEKMKVTGVTSAVGFLSTAGIPPFSGFWSKLLIIMALAAERQWFYASLALLMSVVTLAYFLIMQRKVFFGKLREGLEGIKEARAPITGVAVALAGISTAVGVLFPVAMVLMRRYGII